MSTSQSIENTALGAGITTGLMGVITQNATAISVLCTVAFGLIYACCAIWNAYSNHKRNKVTKRNILDGLIDEMIKDDQPAELIKLLNDKKRKL